MFFSTSSTLLTVLFFDVFVPAVFANTLSHRSCLKYKRMVRSIVSTLYFILALFVGITDVFDLINL